MRALGIDPGMAAMGLGLVEYPTRTLIHVSTIRTNPKLSTQERIAKLVEAIRKLGADVIGLEAQHGAWRGNEDRGTTNDKAVLARVAEGSIRAVAVMLGIPLIELTPAFVRKCIALPGNCAKERVREQIGRLVRGLPAVMSEHAYDALAISIAGGTKWSVSSRIGSSKR